MTPLQIIISISVISACSLSAEAARRQLTQHHVIAKTLYAEARSEGTTGIRMVATVIYNKGNGNIAKCISECHRNKQFSCWNRRQDIPTPNDNTIFSSKAYWNDAQAWAYCKLVEKEIEIGVFKPLGVWTHYAVADCKRRWITTMTDVHVFKQHVFGKIKTSHNNTRHKYEHSKHKH